MFQDDLALLLPFQNAMKEVLNAGRVLEVDLSIRTQS